MNGSGPKIRLPTPTQIKQKYKTCLHKMTAMNQQRSLNFLSITATISRKRERKTKSLNFLYKPATMLRKKKEFPVNYRRGRSYNIESCAVSPRSSITIQFCAQQHEQTYFNIQNQYFRFCKVQIFGELILMVFF